jgi:hypothetical protein
MDDLYIKLLANNRKLKVTEKDKDRCLSTQEVHKLFQILERNFLCYNSVSSNIREFSIFLEANASKIVGTFEKTMSGKGD